MVKKMSRVSRPAPRTVETDVVTRVSAHDISHRAYERFQKRGREHGHDIDDWLLAEAELRDVTVLELSRPLLKRSGTPQDEREVSISPPPPAGAKNSQKAAPKRKRKYSRQGG